MDLNNKLENEEIFCAKEHKRKLRIELLNKLGIYTINDFLNADFNSLIKTPYIRKQYLVFQDILKAKYLGKDINFPLFQYVTITSFNEDDPSIFSVNKIYNLFRDLGYDDKLQIYRLLCKNIGKKCQIFTLIIQMADSTIDYQGKKISLFFIDYVLEHYLDQNVSLHTIDLDGLRQLYFYFLHEIARLRLQSISDDKTAANPNWGILRKEANKKEAIILRISQQIEKFGENNDTKRVII